MANKIKPRGKAINAVARIDSTNDSTNKIMNPLIRVEYDREEASRTYRQNCIFLNYRKHEVSHKHPPAR